MPLQISLSSESGPHNSRWATISPPGWESHDCRVLVGSIDGEPRLIGLQILPKATDPPAGTAIRDVIITRNRLAGFPVQGAARAIGTFLFGGPLDAWEALRAIAEMPEKAADPRQRTTAAKVAAVYRAAREAGFAPRRAVMDQLHISSRTADRYIGQARAEGLLPPYDAEKKGKAKQ